MEGLKEYANTDREVLVWHIARIVTDKGTIGFRGITPLSTVYPSQCIKGTQYEGGVFPFFGRGGLDWVAKYSSIIPLNAKYILYRKKLDVADSKYRGLNPITLEWNYPVIVTGAMAVLDTAKLHRDVMEVVQVLALCGSTHGGGSIPLNHVTVYYGHEFKSPAIVEMYDSTIDEYVHYNLHVGDVSDEHGRYAVHVCPCNSSVDHEIKKAIESCTGLFPENIKAIDTDLIHKALCKGKGVEGLKRINTVSKLLDPLISILGAPYITEGGLHTSVKKSAHHLNTNWKINSTDGVHITDMYDVILQSSTPRERVKVEGTQYHLVDYYLECLGVSRIKAEREYHKQEKSGAYPVLTESVLDFYSISQENLESIKENDLKLYTYYSEIATKWVCDTDLFNDLMLHYGAVNGYPWGKILHLTKRAFQGVTLSYADMTGAVLDNVSFCSHDTLYKVNMTGARLYNVTLARAEMSGADLTNATLYKCRLHDTILVEADLTNARIEGSNMYNADLTGAKIESTALEMSANSMYRAGRDHLGQLASHLLAVMYRSIELDTDTVLTDRLKVLASEWDGSEALIMHELRVYDKSKGTVESTNAITERLDNGRV